MKTSQQVIFSNAARSLPALLACALVATPALATEDAARAQAVVQSCNADPISGFAVLTEIPSDQGVREVDVYLQIDGITPGNHGVHIHETASCTPCGSAGGHFDPGPVGLTSPDGNHPYHLGDLVNVEADANGLGVMTSTTSRVTLTDGPIGLFDADGSAFIVHVNEDTFCPDGVTAGCAGGGRSACALITASVAEESLELAVGPDSRHEGSRPLNRTTVMGDVFVFLAPEFPDSDIEDVMFYFNGEFVKREGFPPYDLLGTRSGGRGTRLDTRTLDNGEHTVAAVIALSSGATEYRAATFTVSNSVFDFFSSDLK